MVDSALVGALIGAGSAVVGISITSYLHSRSEHRKWIRDKKAEAYTNSLRFLYRIKYKRSGITAEGLTYIGKEHVKEMFDDITSMIESVSSLSIFSSTEFDRNIAEQAEHLRNQADHIIKGKGMATDFFEDLDALEKQIRNTAVKDLGL